MPSKNSKATDFSPKAIEILTSHEYFDTSRIRTCIWDVKDRPEFLKGTCVPVCLCVFSLSAIDAEFHLQCFKNIHEALELGGRLLIRDYGIVII